MNSESSSGLRITVADATRKAGVVAEALRAQGHEVVVCDDGATLLAAAAEPDAYVLGPSLTDGSTGLELGEQLRRAGKAAPLVLIDPAPSFETMQRAVRLGVADFVLDPLAPTSLRDALRRCQAQGRPSRRPVAVQPHAIARSYPLEEGVSGRAAREVSAFLVNEGVVAAHRVRIASAVAELVDNAHRHSDSRDGRVTVACELNGSLVRIEVQDRGHGFDVDGVMLDRVPAALPSTRKERTPRPGGGLGRVELLAEDLRAHSTESGARIEAEFQLTPVRFDEEAESLSDTEFLDPTSARRLIAALRGGTADLSGVSAPLAVTIGRIIGGVSSPRSSR
jgi:anti-sigma regulatory factor (Ser/Thr protein kinase)/CheY-like chemotaxis protein